MSTYYLAVTRTDGEIERYEPTWYELADGWLKLEWYRGQTTEHVLLPAHRIAEVSVKLDHTPDEADG